MRRDYVDLFDGDHCSAALAAFFEWATNNELARMRMAQDSGDPWIKASMPRICEETVGLYSIRSLQDRLDYFEENALILVEDNSGIIKRYLFNVSLMSKLLSTRTVLRVLDRQNCHPGKIATPAKPSAELPGDPGKTIGRIAGVSDVYKEVSSICINQQSKTPIVPFEKILPEQRLTPDVVKEIQYSDVDEIELPDEGCKSKTQMPSGDQKRFWTRWNMATGLRPDAREKQRSKFWLASLSFEQAKTAVSGYKNIASEYSLEDFKKRYWESYRAGMSQERAQSVPFVKATANQGQDSPEAPGSPNAQHGVFLMWNEIVISNPLDPPWDWERDNVADLLKVTQDPVFIEKLPEICAKAQALAETGNKSRDFRWMIKSFGKKAGNWWDFLNQKEAPRFKDKETDEERKNKILKAMR